MAHDNTKKQSSSLLGDRPYSTCAALLLAVWGTAAALDSLEIDSPKDKAAHTAVNNKAAPPKPEKLAL